MRIYGGKWNNWIIRVPEDESASGFVRGIMTSVTGDLFGVTERIRAESASLAGYPRIGCFDNILIKATVKSAAEVFWSLGKRSEDMAEFNPADATSGTFVLAPVRFIWRQQPDSDIAWPSAVWATFKPDAEVVLPETKPIDVVPWEPPDIPTLGTGSLPLALALVAAAVGIVVFLRR